MKTEPIVIDKDLCIGCGECVADCCAEHIVLKDGKAEIVGGGCMECGHCYAICPVGAVQMPGYDTSVEQTPVNMSEFDPDRLLLAMKSRRSIRRFKDKPVSQEDIDRIVEAGRYCPTAMNYQNVTIIVQDKNRDALEQLVFDELVRMNWFTNDIDKTTGRKFIFREAPLVIVVAEKRADNGSLASAYMELMANSLGLGVMYCGLVRFTAMHNPEVAKFAGVPEGMKVITCLVIGHPDVKYQRIPPRKDAKLIIN